MSLMMSTGTMEAPLVSPNLYLLLLVLRTPLSSVVFTRGCRDLLPEDLGWQPLSRDTRDPIIYSVGQSEEPHLSVAK